ncbi:histone-like nucleoid-structuring protein Lsr2 [Streptomyces sp. NRRL B-1347]|uniref:histone-like nucleoid-structuring protein Lsr2 n=1 Tax=Streptomyces sp. NRRL B-1347 TaxID=1476877 RepID=UPI0004CC8330|nr:Lsr2 family protein [Streptomyces sp. NRRL B-1347]
MAQKTVIEFFDDLSGEKSDEIQTHDFSLNGVEYEIDLTPENYDKLDAALRPFIDSGRKKGRAKRGARTRGAAVGPSADEVRAWAKGNGYEVNDRGRVPTAIREAYDKAH